MYRSKNLIYQELLKAKEELAISYEIKGQTDLEILQLGDRVDKLLNELKYIQKQAY